MTEKERIKRQLHSYSDLKAEFIQISRELEKVEAVMESPRVQNLDGMPRASGAGDPVLGIVAQHMALQDKYRAQLEKLASAQADIEDLIATLDPVERQLLRYRYLDGLTWEEVCVAVSYSWRQTHNIHARALNKLVARAQQETPIKVDPCDGCLECGCEECGCEECGLGKTEEADT